jgi:hypothetical protein
VVSGTGGPTFSPERGLIPWTVLSCCSAMPALRYVP